MAKDEYSPEVIDENPFPGQDAQNINVVTSKSGGTYNPAKSDERTFPIKRTAVELLSTTLNTRSRKILQSFDLEQSGGLQIGTFKDGETGDIRLTPNGITGRDTDGIVSFTLDTDGNLVVKGEIKSGSFITGQVIVGNNNVIIDVDDGGHPTIVVNDGTNDRVLIGYQAGGF